MERDAFKEMIKDLKVSDLDLERLSAFLGIKIEPYNNKFDLCTACTRVAEYKIGESPYCNEHAFLNIYLRYRWIKEGWFNL
jgi:hypothetical protein